DELGWRQPPCRQSVHVDVGVALRPPRFEQRVADELRSVLWKPVQLIARDRMLVLIMLYRRRRSNDDALFMAREDERHGYIGLVDGDVAHPDGEAVMPRRQRAGPVRATATHRETSTRVRAAGRRRRSAAQLHDDARYRQSFLIRDRAAHDTRGLRSSRQQEERSRD